MPVSKLKNLVILILLTVCIFLLALVVPQRLRQQRAQAEIRSRLESLFASYGLSLEASAIPASLPLSPLEINLDQVTDMTAITALLGEEVLVQDDSSRYFSAYRSALGQCQTSRSGSFQAQLTQGPSGTDLTQLTRTLLQSMGVDAASVSQPVRLSAGVYEVQAVQKLLSVPNFSSELRFHFENTTLVSLSGTLFPGTDAPQQTDEGTCLSATDALVRLLSSRRDLGWVGTAVRSVRQGYLKSETASTSILRFVPVWLIETDTGSFTVHGLTGEVTLFRSAE